MQVELFDDELEQETAAIGIHTLPELEVDTSGPAGMIDRVAEVAQQVIGAGKFPVMLGGEHSVTLGMIRALLKTHPDMGVLQLDAHADLRDSYLGSPYNHACVAKRIQELCPTRCITIPSSLTIGVAFSEYVGSPLPHGPQRP